MRSKKRLAAALSGGLTIGLSLLYAYMLIRSRLNGLGWVAVMEPNNLILGLELTLLIPFMVFCGGCTLYYSLGFGKNADTI